MRLAKLADGSFKVPARMRDLDVSGLTCDSRDVKPGYLFVALPGTRTDGHLFAGAAVKAGAVAVVGEKPHGARRAPVPDQLRVPVFSVRDSRAVLGELAVKFYGAGEQMLTTVGVTGTKGKTTTAWILDSIFRSGGRLSALFGTVHNRIGTTVFPSRNTTPSCLELHSALKHLVDLGGTHAVLEVSSHGISQQRTAGIVFQAGIFTNLASEHLDYHGTIESYEQTKMRFFDELPSSSFAVLSRGERTSEKIARRTPATVVWYGAESEDGVERVRAGPGGMRFRWRGREVDSRLWGYHNLLNLLAAMTCAECLGTSLDDVIRGVEEASAPPGRLESIAHAGAFRVFVDYAHTDGSLDMVLQTLRGITRGRLITIFGCGGDRDTTKRPRMGRVAEKYSDQIVITSDNPRTEDPERIIEDIVAGLRGPDDAVWTADRKEAIALGMRMARDNDTVLIAGKGHEDYQEINGRRHPFDDREVARHFLREAGLLGDDD